MIDYICLGGKRDGRTGTAPDDQPTTVVEGKTYWRINRILDGKWVFIPENSGIPPGRMWNAPPYSPPPPMPESSPARTAAFYGALMGE